MKEQQNKPSRFALTFFNWFCHPEFREEIEGDLMERFNHNAEKDGFDKANWLFVKDVLLLFRPSIVGNIYHLTNTNIMVVTNQNRRLIIILASVISLLFIPLIAMNFTDEVNWVFNDFVVAGVLLLGTGFTLEFILRRVKTSRYRLLFGIALFFTLFLIWAELAVGIF